MFGIKRINPCDVFVALWVLYYLQGLLYPQGIINQLIQLMMILMGLVSFAKCLTMPAPGLIKATVVLVLMYVVYGTAIILFGDGIDWTADSTYLKTSFNSLLPIFFFYLQTKYGSLTEKRIRIYTVVIICCLMVFYTYFGLIFLDYLGVEETTNNVSYMFVSLIPFVYFYYKKPVTQYVLLSVLLAYILMGMKRGAILVGAMSVIIYIYSRFREGTFRQKTAVLFLSMLIVIGAIYAVGYMLETSDYFVKRVESTLEGNSSGRDRIYSSVWNAIKDEQRIVPFLFGHGANSTIKYAGNFAHQDWLETACNNGLVGVLILLTFFLSFFKTVLKSRRVLPPHYFYCFLMLFAICISKTMFSMSIQNFDMYQGMLIGYFAYWVSGNEILRSKQRTTSLQ